MTTEQKIWGFLALLFFIISMVIISTHAFWFVSTLAAPLLIDRVVAVVFRGLHPLPLLTLQPPFASAFDGFGSLFLPLSLLLQEYVPPVSMLLSACATGVGFFCVLMMVRPVNTDFGVLYGLGLVSVYLSVQEFGTGWLSGLVACLFCFMFLLRAHLEHRAAAGPAVDDE